MKRIITAVALILMVAVNSYAVKTLGKDKTLVFDATSFSPVMKANYEVMKSKCVKCHSLERIVVAVTTGIAPITGQPFNLGATKAYGAKMMRNPSANMKKEEVKAAVDLMNYLLEGSAR